MFVNRRQGREAEPAADLFEAWGIPVLLNEVLQVVQNFALSLCKREHVIALQLRHYTQKKGEGQ